MAVIDDLPQVKISVRIAGEDQDCTEYEDPDPPQAPAQCGVATHTSAKVIESQDDAEFLLRYEMSNSLGWFDSDKGIVLKLFIDGNCIESLAFRRINLVGQTVTHDVLGAVILGSSPGQSLLRNFKFSSIATGILLQDFI
ncbi:hypothetical protein C8035_v005232 [Colletotrichum spinosum]|uniref:DUF7918 domain-containing protein n=1 Tax=Colletotrichum spinosum TaxID=1347390 RepID=A0A4R8Q003_9PEZI|nr:hypothetical protein C8035_v005232 [Colletotrichum spinosum]